MGGGSDAPRPDAVPACLRWVIRAEPGQLAPLRRRIRAGLAGLGTAPATVDDLLIVVGEACANAVEHAFLGGPPGTIEVEIARQADGDFVVCVRDTGSWRPRPADGDGTEEGCRGRGIPIMQAVGSEFRRTTGSHGTVVEVRVRPTRGSPAPPGRL